MTTFILKNTNGKTIFKKDNETFIDALNEALKEKLDLTFAKFDTYDLSGADLKGANLQNASFIGCDMQNVNLSGANLENAVLDHADFYEANLTNTNLKNTTCFATIFENTDFKNADLKDADFANVKSFETAKNIALIKNGNSIKNAPSSVKKIITREKSKFIADKISHSNSR